MTLSMASYAIQANAWLPTPVFLLCIMATPDMESETEAERIKKRKKFTKKSTTSTAKDDECEDQNDTTDQDSTSSKCNSDSIDKSKLFKMLFDS